MNTTENLIILYTAIVLINTLVSALLWHKQRTKLSKELFIIWMASFIVLFLQASLTQNFLIVVFGFSFTIFINTAISDFIGTITQRTIKTRYFYAVLGLASSCSAALYFQGVNFVMMSLPVTLAVAAPLLYTATTTITQKHWQKLSFSGKALIIVAFFFAAHNIDFSFLRHIESAANLGFTVATILVFGLSLFAPSIVIESVTKEKTKVSAELDVAQKIQTEILPVNPSIPNFDLACFMKPADEVGGDYYDIYTFNKISWILFGDVTGHGLGSGLVMFMIQSIMSSILHTKNHITPSELNFIANKILFNNLQRLKDQRPMTIASLAIDHQKNVTVSGCHDNMYIFRNKDNHIDIISLDHFPIGIGFTDTLSKEDFDQHSFQLDTGDILFLTTDGLTEARSKTNPNQLFGEEQFITIVQSHAKSSVEELKNIILDKVNEFSGGNLEDDLTFLILKTT